MLEIFLMILSILVPILGIWCMLGLIAKTLGYAKTIKEGMVLVQKKLSAFWGDSSAPTNIEHLIDDYTLAGLTRKLEKHFRIIILEKAEENADRLSIIYRQQDISVPLDIVELTFRKFLLDYCNLPANYPLQLWVRLDEDRLYLKCAYSITGQQDIQTQKNNQRSRQIEANDDLTE